MNGGIKFMPRAFLAFSLAMLIFANFLFRNLKFYFAERMRLYR